MPKYVSGSFVGKELTESMESELWMDGYETGMRIGISSELSQLLTMLNERRRQGATATELCMCVYDRWQDFVSEH